MRFVIRIGKAKIHCMFAFCKCCGIWFFHILGDYLLNTSIHYQNKFNDVLCTECYMMGWKTRQDKIDWRRSYPK